MNSYCICDLAEILLEFVDLVLKEHDAHRVREALLVLSLLLSRLVRHVCGHRRFAIEITNVYRWWLRDKSLRMCAGGNAAESIVTLP